VYFLANNNMMISPTDGFAVMFSQTGSRVSSVGGPEESEVSAWSAVNGVIFRVKDLDASVIVDV